MRTGAPSPGAAEAASAVSSTLPPCLIINPRSFSASRGLAQRASKLALERGAEVVCVDGPAALTAAVESILARRQRQLIILGGDGTVCAIVDQLSKLPEGAWTPDLLVLPGGRSNLTAADLVPGSSALSTLRRALELACHGGWDGAIEERRALRIEQSPDTLRHGFFLAAALIDSAIRQVHQYRIDRKFPVDLSTWSYLLQLGVRSLFGRSGLACAPLDIDAGVCGVKKAQFRLLIATTLLHQQGLFNPYANRGEGDVRMTAVSAEAPGFWRSLPGLLMGRFPAWMNVDCGYLSGRCERLQISGLRTYMLDGEPFDADPDRPLTITAGPRLRYLRP